MFERGERLKVRLIKRSMLRDGVIALLFCMVPTVAPAVAQESAGTLSETLTSRPDLNGRDVVSERMVTHHGRTNDEERIVIESYVPVEYADRLALNRRVRRVTTATSTGTQIVEETEERNPVAPSESLRMVRRTVTTVRSGAGSHVTERKVFERDVEGRFVLVRTEVEHSSPK